MNELDKLAAEKFNGDMDAAIEYVRSGALPNEESEKIFTNLTSAQASKFIVSSWKTKEDKKQFEKALSSAMSNQIDLQRMNLSRKELVKMEKNPFKAKVGKGFLKMLVINALLLTGAFITNSLGIGALAAALGGISTIVTASLSIDLMKDIMNLAKFKKLRDTFREEDEWEKQNIKGGR